MSTQSYKVNLLRTLVTIMILFKLVFEHEETNEKFALPFVPGLIMTKII